MRNIVGRSLSSNLALYDSLLNTLGESLMPEMSKTLDRMLSGTENVHLPVNTKKVKDDYVIEIAMAGYKKEDIKVAQSGSTLTVTATRNEENEEETEYIYRGISFRKNSKQTFALQKGAKVKSVKYENGLLTIVINRPDEKPEDIEFTIE